MTAFVVRRFVDRSLLGGLSANPARTLRHPGQVDQVCRREDLADVVAADTPLGPEQAAARLRVRRADFDQRPARRHHGLQQPQQRRVLLLRQRQRVTDHTKALGIPPEHIPAPLPRSFSPAEKGRIERVMAGEPEPPSDSNTGGAGWIIEGKQPDVLRALFMDFKAGIDGYFPNTVTHLTDHEIRELEARSLWFDRTEPPRPGEFGPEPDHDDGDNDAFKRGGGKHRGGGKPARRDAVTSPRQALEAIKSLSGV
ncbi:hypothetical protein [Streptomyces kanasensis]|uniref:hypothetical protein n=1 Tax=Streptomyces kanasensis TaxID=936756 RepID=UPI000A6C4DB3|nr:hypothetical protein [Streptomyces kanasensis]